MSCVHVLSSACFSLVLIDARVIEFRDNAEFVLFSFAWFKPALGRGSSVTCPRERGCRGQLPQEISRSVYVKQLQLEGNGEAGVSHAGVEETIKEVQAVASSDSEDCTDNTQDKVYESLSHSEKE